MSGARLALLAAASALLIGGASAQAADLGGNCCADLEERIAELEATTARKGNRKVSLTISGQVAKAVMFWDDGAESDAYVVDNDNAQTRFRFAGKARIADGWEAGYLLEIGVDNSSSDGVTQTDDNANGAGLVPGRTGGGDAFMEVRQSKWFIKSKDLGTVTVGLGSGAQDDLYKWGNVGKAYSDAELHFNGQFALRASNGALLTRRWDDVANNLDLSRTNNVRYDSPEFAGFIASASWGEDDIWDVALRFDKKFSDDNIHVKAGIAYTEDSDVNGVVPTARGNETKDLVASAGISEKTTGLYVYGAYGTREIDDQPVGFDDKATYYYGQLGINRELIPIGATNFHVDYGVYEGWGVGASLGEIGGAAFGRMTESEITRYGAGVTQNLKSAEMDLYAVFNYYEADITTTTAGALDLDAWYAVVTGARIQF